MTFNHQYLQENLRTLISTASNIAEAARRLGINRQQLNKYLSGDSTPSLRVLSKFSDEFQVPIDGFLLNPSKFIEMYIEDDVHEGLPKVVLDSARRITLKSIEAEKLLGDYCGVYFRISKMPSMPYKIIRAVTNIYQKDSITFATTVEVFPGPSLDGRKNKRKTRRLHAIVLYFDNRIYFIDASQNSRIMMMIAYPNMLPRMEYLQGRAMSVSDVGARKIFNIPFLLKKINEKHVKKVHLLSCGVFDADSEFIGDEERRRLQWDE